MNHLQLICLLAPAVAVTIDPLPQQTAPPRLVRIVPQTPAQEPFDASAWRARLSASDLDQREQDFAALGERVRRDPAARAEVEEWAREGDGELAWTARLLLRDAEARGRNPFGGALAMPPSLWPQGADDLEQRLGDLHGWMQALELDPRGEWRWNAPPNALPPSGSRSTSQSFELRSGPDGVHVTILEDQDGDSEKKEYSAESLDRLLEEHPELREKLDGDLHGLAPHGGSGLQLFFGDRTPAEPRLRTDVLGVSVRPLPKSEAKALGVDEGVGLMVERVERRSIAAALGIQRGHVLVGMNDQALRGAQDITDQLCSRPSDGEIRVELIDRWGQRRTRTWRPESPDSAPAPESGSGVGAPAELRKI